MILTTINTTQLVPC